MHHETNNHPLEYAPPEGEWMRPDMRVAVFFAGFLFMFFSLFQMTVTLSSGRYAAVLIQGLLAAIGADVCFLIACWRARLAWRVASAVAAAPTVFVVLEFMRRW